MFVKDGAAQLINTFINSAIAHESNKYSLENFSADKSCNNIKNSLESAIQSCMVLRSMRIILSTSLRMDERLKSLIQLIGLFLDNALRAALTNERNIPRFLSLSFSSKNSFNQHSFTTLEMNQVEAILLL